METNNKLHNALILTLLQTGLRMDEVISMHRSDIETHEQGWLLHIKNQSDSLHRSVPLTEECAHAFTFYLE